MEEIKCKGTCLHCGGLTLKGAETAVLPPRSVALQAYFYQSFTGPCSPRTSLPTSTSWSHQPIMAGSTNAGTPRAACHGLSCNYINISALGPLERKSRCDLPAPQPSFQCFSLTFITWQDNQVKSLIGLTSQLTPNLCSCGLQRAKQHHFLNIWGGERVSWVYWPSWVYLWSSRKWWALRLMSLAKKRFLDVNSQCLEIESSLHAGVKLWSVSRGHLLSALSSLISFSVLLGRQLGHRQVSAGQGHSWWTLIRVHISNTFLLLSKVSWLRWSMITPSVAFHMRLFMIWFHLDVSYHLRLSLPFCHQPYWINYFLSTFAYAVPSAWTVLSFTTQLNHSVIKHLLSLHVVL